ncbi:MAG: GAF domain-containing protein, partial [Gammaproteobacteria bacterium]
MAKLSVLRRIIQEVNQAPSLLDALQIIVEHVREAMETEVCSIYLLDPETNRYILMATKGLRPEAVGKVTLGHSEGLVGLVGVREEPVNLDNAPDHPRFRYFPETGEEIYRSFLGVPIIHQRKNLGVLVVQQKSTRQFDEGEEAFLLTVSAQLAGVIAHTEAMDPLQSSPEMPRQKRDVRFRGVAGAPGVGMGVCVVKYPPADLSAVPVRAAEDVEAEIDQFSEAVRRVKEDIQRVSSNLCGSLRPEEAALFAVYANMLDDNALSGE